MSLSDMMSAAGLSSWAEVGLIISFITFVGITAYVLFRRRAAWDAARYLPLDDEEEPRGTEQ
jgi:cbb3-type cytochrome oxidase subunit 3